MGRIIGGAQLTVRRAALAAGAVGLAVAAVGCGAGTTVKSKPQAPASKPLTFTQLIANVRSGIVKLRVDTCDGSDVGTGFLVGDRLIATVDHVVDGAASIALVRSGVVVGHGTVIGADPARDLALVKSDRAITGYHFKLAARAPQLGEDVAAIGFPLDLPLTVTRGSVSGSDRTIPINGLKRRSLVQTDAAVNPGNSGGPLITDAGAVVGLVDLGTDQANGLAFAVSAKVAGPLLQAWQVAPQPVAQAACAPAQTSSPSQAAAPAATSTSPSILTFTGSDFTIGYPASFTVTSAEQDMGTYYDTSIENGDYLIRVDESPNGSTTPDQAAAPELAQLRSETGYREISVDHVTFNGYQALRWEFEVPEHGVLLHKVDLFFQGDTGSDWGVLTQAPASDWSQVSGALDAITTTFAETR